MATTLMASSSSSTLHFLRKPLQSPSIRAQITVNETPRFKTLLKPLAATIPLSISAIPMPALAEQIEKAALFDFNLTLPAIALEFLLLMVALDKIYFTPLGKFMEDRDKSIRAQLTDVKDTSGEVKQLEEQAAAVMKAAMAEISAALNKMKKETTVELELKLAEGKKKVEEELAAALAALENEKEETLKALDSQIQVLSDEIVSKVLPSGIRSDDLL